LICRNDINNSNNKMLEQEAHSPTVDKRNGSKDDFVAYLTEGF
jgi:hypothetical protein